MTSCYSELRDKLVNYGTILLKLGEHPLTEAELDRLDQLSDASRVPYEHVLIVMPARTTSWMWHAS